MASTVMSKSMPELTRIPHALAAEVWYSDLLKPFPVLFQDKINMIGLMRSKGDQLCCYFVNGLAEDNHGSNSGSGGYG